MEVEIVLEADPRTVCPVQLPKALRATLMSAIVSKSSFLITADLKTFESIKGQRIQGVMVCSVKDYLAAK